MCGFKGFCIVWIVYSSGDGGALAAAAHAWRTVGAA